MQKNKKFHGLVAIFTLIMIYIGIGGLYAQQNQQQEELANKTKINVAGTGISASLPDVFRFDDTQSTYIYSGAAASISFQQLNGTPYSSVIKGMSSANFESQKMKLITSQEIITLSGFKGMLYETSVSGQSAAKDEKVEFKRYIFFTGNNDKTVWVTANFPLITESLLRDVIIDCMKSVEF